MLLNCNSSLRVAPLLPCDLSNLGVLLLLLNSLILPLSLTNLTTVLLFLYNLGGIAKLSESHDFMTHSPKIRVKH